MGRPDAAGGDARARSTRWSATGKVRYVGASNYAGWQLMKALGDRRARTATQRFVSQQIYYSLQARDAEYELVPGWPSTRASASSSGARWPAACCPASTAAASEAPGGHARTSTDWNEPPIRDQERLYDIVDALVEIAEAHGVSAGPGGAGLAAGPARRDLGGRSARAPTSSSPTTSAAADLTLDRRRARAAGRGQRAAAALPVLAPAQDVERPARPGRPDAARRPHLRS